MKDVTFTLLFLTTHYLRNCVLHSGKCKALKLKIIFHWSKINFPPNGVSDLLKVQPIDWFLIGIQQRHNYEF